jgi:ankyrin repeat protein
MYKEVLRGISSQRVLPESENAVVSQLTSPEFEHDDLKSDEKCEITNMNFVNEHRDFSKITENDLAEVFRILKARCPETWTNELEIRAKELNQKFMTLRNGSTTMFIDPELKLEAKTEQTEVQRLMTAPECWSMDTRERGYEFSEILRHFTIFAPFEGRPFVRAWLEALVPCFSRWILLSDSTESKVVEILKIFLGAFGQPGIVVCLEDKGTAVLEILKKAARSVEAIGRGTVERHYWKRLTESFCGGDSGWRRLANIKNKPLLCSQLDYLPKDWLLDANDWCQIFANLVSPEISKHFEKKIVETLNDNKLWLVKAGPPKTLGRCQAKAREYKKDFENENLQRWSKFGKKFESVFQRVPSKPEDFIWNIVDFARCSITVPGADDVIKVWRIIEKQFQVICVKNSYNSKVHIKGSGYRDLKLLIEVEFDHLQLDGVPKAQPKTTLICEIQILCQAWLENKRSTSMSYKILRALTLRDLLLDASKYVKHQNTNVSQQYKDVAEILKNGWLNFAKAADFTNIDADELLISAIKEEWNVAGVNMLVKDFGANIEVESVEKDTPIIAVCRLGKIDVVKCLIQLGSNIDKVGNCGETALIAAATYGHEDCVRILLSAKALVEVKDEYGMSAVDHALQKVESDSTMKYKRIVQLLKGEEVSVRGETGKTRSKFDELKKAAVEGSLAQFLDGQDVPHALISELLVTEITLGSLENLLQALWFGGKVEQKSAVEDMSPVYLAAMFGTPATITVLLQAGATVNVRDPMGGSPLSVAARYRSPAIVNLFLEAKADVNLKDNDGDTVDVYANLNVDYSENVLNLLAEHRRAAENSVLNNDE